MRRILVCCLTLILALFAPGSAFAAPDEVPSWSLIIQDTSGENVVRVQLRLRELGYLNFKPTGNFRGMSVSAVRQYQQVQLKDDGTPMIADGTVGEETRDLLFRPSATRAAIPASVHIPFGPAAGSGTTPVAGKLVAWSTVKTQLVEGMTYSVTDYNTNQNFSVVFTGGENHAEVECATPSDTATFLSVFGGEFNFSKRPVTVMIDGTRVAASLQGQAHGADTVAANEMAGYACLFFDGSLSHVGSLPDTEHTKQIYIASGHS
ncbi:MAG: peptidoglycan-binding domain-containing protein [Bacillota bacterium]